MSVALASIAAAPSALAGQALPACAFLDGIGMGEMVLVALVGLLLFGGKGLPDMARTLGRVVREFKKATQGVEDEVRRVMHEEPEPAPRPRPRPPRTLPSALPPADSPASPPQATSQSMVDLPATPPVVPSTPPRTTPPTV